mgnify:CR=1 FL=1
MRAASKDGTGRGSPSARRRLLQCRQPFLQARTSGASVTGPWTTAAAPSLLTGRFERIGGQHPMADAQRAVALRRLDAPQLLDRGARVLSIEQQRFRAASCTSASFGCRSAASAISRAASPTRPAFRSASASVRRRAGRCRRRRDRRCGCRPRRHTSRPARRRARPPRLQAEHPGKPQHRRGRIRQTPARRPREQERHRFDREDREEATLRVRFPSPHAPRPPGVRRGSVRPARGPPCRTGRRGPPQSSRWRAASSGGRDERGPSRRTEISRSSTPSVSSAIVKWTSSGW